MERLRNQIRSSTPSATQRQAPDGGGHRGGLSLADSQSRGQWSQIDHRPGDRAGLLCQWVWPRGSRVGVDIWEEVTFQLGLDRGIGAGGVGLGTMMLEVTGRRRIFQAGGQHV